MKRGWLLYEENDLSQNRDFAAHMEKEGSKRNLAIETVRTAQLTMGIKAGGALFLRKDGRDALPDFVIARQRDAFTRAQFEGLGVPVFNNARACAICNDKRVTHQFLAGLPMMETTFVNHRYATVPDQSAFPMIVKPAASHGGDRVVRVAADYEWREAMDDILPQDALEQRIADGGGQDLRVYVLFGQTVAAVLRTARHGPISNFKRGGSVALHSVTSAEQALVSRVLERFAQAGAPLSFAGIDMLYDHGEPVLSEVEDVVGSRMLYKVSDIDIAGLYLDAIRTRV